MNRPANRSSRPLVLVLGLALSVLFLPVGCGRSEPSFRAGGGPIGPYRHGQDGRMQAPAGGHSHRSSFGGGDVTVGSDGNGFHYYIDSSGSSWSGG